VLSKHTRILSNPIRISPLDQPPILTRKIRQVAETPTFRAVWGVAWGGALPVCVAWLRRVGRYAYKFFTPVLGEQHYQKKK